MTIAMTTKISDGLCNDGLFRMRYMKSIADQIKEDHSELSHLWESSKNGPIDKYQEEECLRLTDGDHQTIVGDTYGAGWLS